MDVASQAAEMAKSNLALVQIQGIVVGSLAACFAMVMGWGPILKWVKFVNSYYCLNLYLYPLIT